MSSTDSRVSVSSTSSESEVAKVDGQNDDVANFDNAAMQAVFNADSGLPLEAALPTEEKILEYFATQVDSESIQSLGRSIGLKTPDALTAFEKEFKKNIVCADMSLSPSEKLAGKKLKELHDVAIATLPALRGKLAQFKNSTATASIAFAAGFGAIVALVRFAAMASLPAPANLVVAAGPVIMFVGEILAGKYRAQGPGYPAADNTAYLDHGNHSGDMARNYLDMMALEKLHDLTNPDAPETEPLKAAKAKLTLLKAANADLALKCRVICGGLIQQEFGHRIGLKRTDDTKDVPECYPRSGIQWTYVNSFSIDPDDIRVSGSNDNDNDNDDVALEPVKGQLKFSLPDGRTLFNIVMLEENGRMPPTTKWDKTSLMVRWPGGKETDLMKDRVPPEHGDLWIKAEELLVGAAKDRAKLIEEGPYSLFGLWYMISGALGPLVSVTVGGTAGIVADLAVSLPITFFATQSLVHAQNAARSEIGGAVFSPGTNTAVRDEKGRTARFHLKRLDTWATSLRKMESEMRKTLGQLRLHLMTHEDPLAEKQVKVFEHALETVRNAQKTCVKQHKAMQEIEEANLNKAGGIRVGWRQAIKAYGGNPAQMTAKLIGYTAGYIAYTQAFVTTVATLKTGTTMAAFFGLSSLNGFAMLTGFVFRNQFWAYYGEAAIKFTGGSLDLAGASIAKAAPPVATAVSTVYGGVSTVAGHVAEAAGHAAGAVGGAAGTVWSAAAAQLLTCWGAREEVFVDITPPELVKADVTSESLVESTLEEVVVDKGDDADADAGVDEDDDAMATSIDRGNRKRIEKLTEVTVLGDSDSEDEPLTRKKRNTGAKSLDGKADD
ncbi:MAG: hypothetical protein V4787_06290 [Pseudomonadota bacterium]